MFEMSAEDYLFTPSKLLQEWKKDERHTWNYTKSIKKFKRAKNLSEKIPSLKEFLNSIKSIIDFEGDLEDIEKVLNSKSEGAWEGGSGEERMKRGISDYIQKLEEELGVNLSEDDKEELRNYFKGAGNQITKIFGIPYSDQQGVHFQILNGNNYVKVLKFLDNIRSENKEELKEYRNLEGGREANKSAHEDKKQIWFFGNTCLELYGWINLQVKGIFIYNGKVSIDRFLDSFEKVDDFESLFERFEGEYKKFIKSYYDDFVLPELKDDGLPDDLSNEEKEVVLKHIELDQFFQFLSEKLPNYWKISPGERANKWEEFRKRDCIAIGWLGSEDLSDIEKKSELEAKLKDYNQYSEGQNKSQIWNFLENISKGDYIIANKGKSKIVGIGKVKSDYIFDESLSHPHKRMIDWKWTGNKKISNQGSWAKTVIKLELDTIRKIKAGLRNLDNKRVTERFSEEQISLEELSFNKLVFDDPQSLKEQIKSAIHSGKNIIFTGPPGTGKSELADLIAKRLKKENREKIDGKKFTTATADWTTFDTIGGYRPKPNTENDLDFSPGLFLKCLPEIREGELFSKDLSSDIIIIDEINRADIDKAFGQLFSVLSGSSVSLPFSRRRDEKDIEIHIDYVKTRKSLERLKEDENDHYLFPHYLPIIATMNTFDKTSLYEMSYAFMRRFAFIRVPAPGPKEIDELWNNYLGAWELSDNENVKKLWRRINKETSDSGDEKTKRAIGPAMAEDILRFVNNYNGDYGEALASAVISFVLPQYEGVKDNKALVKNIHKFFKEEFSSEDGENKYAEKIKEASEDMLKINL